MLKIKELVKCPSEALEAMLQGMEEQSQRTDFKIQMTSFGYTDGYKKICCGCAATCTIQKLAGKNFTYNQGGYILSPTGRAAFLDFDKKELNDFEDVIDRARKGGFIGLFRFYYPLFNPSDIPEILAGIDYEDFYLSSADWQDQTGTLQQIIEAFKLHGY